MSYLIPLSLPLRSPPPHPYPYPNPYPSPSPPLPILVSDPHLVRIPPSALKLHSVHACFRFHPASSAGAKALYPPQNPCVLDNIREIARWPLTRPRALAPLSDIRNANDAHRIFEAVRLGLLPLVTRRLTPTERDLLRSGQVFVWEEGSSSGGGAEDGTPSAGLERWTDGRRWYVRTIRLLDPLSCHLLSHPIRLTIVPGHSRVCASHSSSMKRKYKQPKKKNTKRPFDAPAKRPPLRIPSRQPTILPFVARIDLPSQMDSRNKLIRVSTCAFGSGGCLLVSLLYTNLLPFHLLLTFRFDTAVHHLDCHSAVLNAWITLVHT